MEKFLPNSNFENHPQQSAHENLVLAKSVELDLLSKLDKHFISLHEQSFEKTLFQCVEIAKVLTKARVCHLKLIHDHKKPIMSTVTSSCDQEPIKKAVFEIGDYVARRVIETKRPLLINDFPRFIARQSYEDFCRDEWCSVLAVPIAVREEALGALTAFDKKKDVFTKEDCRLLLCFANHIAILIDDIRTHNEVHSAYINTIKSLVSAIEAKDPYTRGHSEKVTKYSIDIATALNLSHDEKTLLMYCGRLHDVGKIAISDAILNKPGPLTPSERAAIQLHPLKGVDILSNLKFLEDGLPAVRNHHEWFDGSGYPDGLRGKDIPFMARIISCADAFDAMTSDRSYRQALPIAEALARMQANSGIQFDPELVEVFTGLIKTKMN